MLASSSSSSRQLVLQRMTCFRPLLSTSVLEHRLTAMNGCSHATTNLQKQQHRIGRHAFASPMRSLMTTSRSVPLASSETSTATQATGILSDSFKKAMDSKFFTTMACFLIGCLLGEVRTNKEFDFYQTLATSATTNGKPVNQS